jgi:hypothetical protein
MQEQEQLRRIHAGKQEAEDLKNALAEDRKNPQVSCSGVVVAFSFPTLLHGRLLSLIPISNVPSVCVCVCVCVGQRHERRSAAPSANE